MGHSTNIERFLEIEERNRKEIHLLCSARTKDGKRCKMHCLKDEKFCIAHSNSQRAKQIRAKRSTKRVLTDTELIQILQQELRKVRRVKNDEFRSGEIRRIIELISQLKGEKLPASNGKKTQTFEERVKQVKLRMDDGKN